MALNKEVCQEADRLIAEALAQKDTKGWEWIATEFDKIYKMFGISNYNEILLGLSDKNREMLAVLDKDGNLTSEFMLRKAIHDNHIPHREVSCLILKEINTKLGPKMAILLGKRSFDKSSYGGSWGLIAGHVVGNKETKDAVRDEATEEVHTPFDKEDFMQLIRPTKNEREDNLAWVTAYAVSSKLFPNQFLFQESEISGMAWHTLDQFETMVRNQNPQESIFKNNDYYNTIIQALQTLEKVPHWNEFLATRTFKPLQEAIGLVNTKDKPIKRRFVLKRIPKMSECTNTN